ncbi:MAG TPA: DUF4124 domain-containing protein [Methylotenera sp.]|nr:DUF4124 domain-containing protein [Methylotenera sp.]
MTKVLKTKILASNINRTAKQSINLSMLSLLVLMAFMQYAHADASKIVKWKDDKGATHYGDSVPAQYANRENSVISKQGITVQRNKPISYQDKALDLAKQEQDKKDKALLSAFTEEGEIDLARDRNLQLDKVTIEGLELQKTNSQKKLLENQKYASDFIKRKKPVPTDLSTDIKSSQAEITKHDQQIAERKASMENIRKRFDDDKKRYIALRNPTSNTSTETPVKP